MDANASCSSNSKCFLTGIVALRVCVELGKTCECTRERGKRQGELAAMSQRRRPLSLTNCVGIRSRQQQQTTPRTSKGTTKKEWCILWRARGKLVRELVPRRASSLARQIAIRSRRPFEKRSRVPPTSSSSRIYFLVSYSGLLSHSDTRQVETFTNVLPVSPHETHSNRFPAFRNNRISSFSTGILWYSFEDCMRYRVNCGFRESHILSGP